MNTMKRLDLRGLAEEEIINICEELGLKRFRAGQIFQWVQKKGIRCWKEISNIGLAEQEKLQERLELKPLELVREQHAKDGTRKYLFRLADGESIECVLMDYERSKTRERHTVCLSTQVGCAVGCTFCATGMMGFRRNLSAAEIVSQVLEIVYLMRREEPEFRVTNIVFMGMGEPLLNYETVMKAIRLLNDEKGQAIGMRRMTISTSGVVPKIRQLARDNPQVGLAISLHAPTDELRNSLVPMNRLYPLAELMAACRDYSRITNRRITFETAMIAGQADQKWAEDLAELLQDQLGHVNLIPVNPVAGTGMERPHQEQLMMVARMLEQSGIPVSVREERGTDIDAACGQLRQRWERE